MKPINYEQACELMREKDRLFKEMKKAEKAYTKATIKYNSKKMTVDGMTHTHVYLYEPYEHNEITYHCYNALIPNDILNGNVSLVVDLAYQDKVKNFLDLSKRIIFIPKHDKVRAKKVAIKYMEKKA